MGWYRFTVMIFTATFRTVGASIIVAGGGGGDRAVCDDITIVLPYSVVYLVYSTKLAMRAVCVYRD